MGLGMSAFRGEADGNQRPSLFLRLRHFGIAFEALVLKDDPFDGNLVTVGVEFWKRLVLGNPAAIDHVAQDNSALLVEQIDPHVLAKIAKRHGSVTRWVVSKRRPILKSRVMCNAAFQDDRIEVGETGRCHEVIGKAPVPPMG